MYKDVTGIILAGGKSSRMGENKALMKLGEQTVIERVVDLMSGLFPEVILSTNSPEEYEFLGLPMYRDEFVHRGPLAGIHSGLKNSKTDQNFIISCDIPLLASELIQAIMDFRTEQPVTVCRAEGFVQQLAGRYSKTVLQLAKASLTNEENETRAENQKHRKCKVLSLLETVGAEIIDAESLPAYKPGMFLNMNRPDEYEEVKRKLEQVN